MSEGSADIECCTVSGLPQPGRRSRGGFGIDIVCVPLPFVVRWLRRGFGIVFLGILIQGYLSGAFDKSNSNSQIVSQSRSGLVGRSQIERADGNQFGLFFVAPEDPEHSSGPRILAGSGSSTSGCGSHHEHEHKLEDTLAFLFFCFLICCGVEWLNLKLPINLRFPISVVMFVTGKVVGTIVLKFFAGNNWVHDLHIAKLIGGLEGAAWFDPHALLYILLPPLLYESASSMSWRVLRKVLPSAVLLAVPGVVLNTFITGIFVMLSVRVKGSAPSLPTSLLLSSILSATDPVAVVASLSALGAPPKLSAMVEGESLLNDGSAVVATYVFRDWVLGESGHNAGQYCPGSPPNPGCVFGYFCHVAIGGAAIGIVAGLAIASLIKRARVFYMSVLEMAIILLGIYGVFFAAEALKTSGVLAVVSLGFMMAAHISVKLSHEGRHNHHVILAQIGYACNQVTFFGAGIISARFMWTNTDDVCVDHTSARSRAWFELFGLYVCIHVSRALVIGIFSPIITRIGYGMTWKESLIMIYGGLRGAVGLVMSLIVEHSGNIDPAVSQMIAFHTSGIVLLTLLINGSTVDEVYRALDIYPPSPFRRTYLRKVLSRLEQECQKADIRHLTRDWFFFDCAFTKILRCVPNFATIGFDVAGIPHPEGILKTKHVLRSLEVDALVAKKTSHRTSETDEYEFRWQKRKEGMEEKLSKLAGAGSCPEDVKDQILNVGTTGERTLAFKGSDRINCGLYVSCRSLDFINGGAEDANDMITQETLVNCDDVDVEEQMVEDAPYFEVHLEQAERSRIIIGFLANSGAVRRIEPDNQHRNQGVIGYIEDSFGFNIKTGEIRYNGPAGADTLQPFDGAEDDEEDQKLTPFFESERSSFPCPTKGDSGPKGSWEAPAENATVRLSVHRRPGHDWEVTVTIKEFNLGGAEVKFMKTCSFGPFNPKELYPVIEFRGEPQGLKRAQSTLSVISTTFIGGPSKGAGATGSATPLSFGQPAQNPPKPNQLPKLGTTSLSRDAGAASSSSDAYSGQLGRGASAQNTDDTRVEDFCDSEELGQTFHAPGKLLGPSKLTQPPVHGERKKDKGDEFKQILSPGMSMTMPVGNTNVSMAAFQELPGRIDSDGNPKPISAMAGPAAMAAALHNRKMQRDGSLSSDEEEYVAVVPMNISDSTRPQVGGAQGVADPGTASAQIQDIAPQRSSKRSASSSFMQFVETQSNMVTGGLAGGGPGSAGALAQVALSFEPQCASDTESINELWNVLFNTVRQRYLLMHEHGILGDTALAWLIEAVGEAVDCASRELNALSALDFVKKDNSKPESMGKTKSQETEGPGRKSWKKFKEAITGQESTTLAIGNKIRRSLGNFISGQEASSISEEPDNVLARLEREIEEGHGAAFGTSNFHGVYEPIIVEYLSLTQKITKSSIWDRLPKRFEKLRQNSYTSTKTKVDALWAFVVAHEKVIHDSPTLERFPDLVHCISGVISEVREDLRMLQEIEPERYFFCKHVLALRVLMNKRLKKLHHFEEEGRLTSGDVEGLEKALQERIVQADQYAPTLNTLGAWRVSTAISEEATGVVQNAWKDVDLVVGRNESTARKGSLLAMGHEMSFISEHHSEKKKVSQVSRRTGPMKREGSA